MSLLCVHYWRGAADKHGRIPSNLYRWVRVDRLVVLAERCGSYGWPDTGVVSYAATQS
jgi:hypothetical protein